MTIPEFVEMLKATPDKTFVCGGWSKGNARCCLLSVIRHHMGIDLRGDDDFLDVEDVAELLDMRLFDVDDIANAVDDLSDSFPPLPKRIQRDKVIATVEAL